MFNFHELGLKTPPREPWDDNGDYNLPKTYHAHMSNGSTSTSESYSLNNNLDKTFLEYNRSCLIDQIWQNGSIPFQPVNISTLPSENFDELITLNEENTRNIMPMPIDLIQPSFPQISVFMNEMSHPRTLQQKMSSLYLDQTVSFTCNRNIEPEPYIRDPENYFTYPECPTHFHFNLVTYFIEDKNMDDNKHPETDLFTTQIFHPSGNPCYVKIQMDPVAPFRYRCTFYASEAGVYNGYVHILGKRNINGSPFTISVTRKYSKSKTKIIVGAQPIEIGSTLNGQKEYVKTWGIDVDRFVDKIYIVDKGLHKIRIFSCEGIPLTEFGNKGSDSNQFYRPTGIAVDPINKRFMISDKDNHRICILTLDGQFIKTFGKEGNKDGELNYPWGLAVSPSGELIAVADSKNHRIQLFDKNGNFLRKYSLFETNPAEYKKQFDYPRGICFDNMGQYIYVSDMNLHTVFMLNIGLTELSILVPKGKLFRPQGLTVDIAGNILICDSRNNYVRVIGPDGISLCNIKGTGIDSPQDLSILRGGLLTIMDSKGVVSIY